MIKTGFAGEVRRRSSVMRDGRTRTRRGQRGASAVEFAIVLPLLLLVLFAIVEFGLALYDKQLITTASGNAARAAIAYVGGTTPTHASVSSICSVATNSANGVVNLTSSATPVVTVTDTPASGAATTTACATAGSTAVCSQGDTIEVQVAYSFGGLALGSSFNPLVSVSNNTLGLSAFTTAQCM